MSTIYNGLQFRTQLEAHWAAFFDLAKWSWKLNPSPVGNWSPDFQVTFPCSHSECGGTHTLLVAVLPVTKIDDFSQHPCLSHRYGINGDDKKIHASIDTGAGFGVSPKVTTWEFVHGAGGGVFDVEFFVPDADILWSKAENMVS
ncbi:hypothetical protein [Yersinia aldovae]|uniref:hypothetical protein n=1 Tax=Yersinia aldovae TaxID=29483 RepID=UPI0011A1BFF2|nr:hypothetical protein [Yersinia aldovae]